MLFRSTFLPRPTLRRTATGPGRQTRATASCDRTAEPRSWLWKTSALNETQNLETLLGSKMRDDCVCVTVAHSVLALERGDHLRMSCGTHLLENRLPIGDRLSIFLLNGREVRRRTCHLLICHVPTIVWRSEQLSATLQVGEHATGNTHDVVRVRTEVVVPCPCRGPHLVVLQQVRVDEHTQLRRVTEGRHATVGFRNLSLLSPGL